MPQRVSAVVLVLVLVAAACGDEGSDAVTITTGESGGGIPTTSTTTTAPLDAAAILIGRAELSSTDRPEGLRTCKAAVPIKITIFPDQKVGIEYIRTVRSLGSTTGEGSNYVYECAPSSAKEFHEAVIDPASGEIGAIDAPGEDVKIFFGTEVTDEGRATIVGSFVVETVVQIWEVRIKASNKLEECEKDCGRSLESELPADDS